MERAINQGVQGGACNLGRKGPPVVDLVIKQIPAQATGLPKCPYNISLKCRVTYRNYIV